MKIAATNLESKVEALLEVYTFIPFDSSTYLW